MVAVPAPMAAPMAAEAPPPGVGCLDDKMPQNSFMLWVARLEGASMGADVVVDDMVLFLRRMLLIVGVRLEVVVVVVVVLGERKDVFVAKLRNRNASNGE
jgi:hypothetical protein